MKQWIYVSCIASLTALTACFCDRTRECSSTDRSVLRIDEREFSFRMFSDSIFFTETEDSLRVYYSELSFNAVTVDLYLHNSNSGTFTIDTSRSTVILYNERGVAPDTLRLARVSVITEAYQPPTCCQLRGCWQTIPDEMKAQILGELRSGETTRILYFDIDVITRERESVEC